MASIGFAMIMQNEETHIPPAIAEFYNWVEDIVVVDGGSTDGSVEWAERMGARVFHRPFARDFSAQKNFAIEQLRTDWIYLHDPDERLEPTLLEIFPLLTEQEGQKALMNYDLLPQNEKPFDCLGVARRNFIDGKQTKVYPDYQYRLFKNYCRFEGSVHEVITGFNNRTEVDFRRSVLDSPSRFNILHYKSSQRQNDQNALYDKIRRGEI